MGKGGKEKMENSVGTLYTGGGKPLCARRTVLKLHFRLLWDVGDLLGRPVLSVPPSSKSHPAISIPNSVFVRECLSRGKEGPFFRPEGGIPRCPLDLRARFHVMLKRRA